MRFCRAFLTVLGLGFASACHAVTQPAAPASVSAPPPSPAPAPAAEDVRGLPIGTKLPPFQLERVDGGGRVGLPNGKVTILAFLATWNEPAKKMLLPLQQIYAAGAAKGIEVIAIYVDDEVDGVRAFGDTHGAKFPSVWDKGHVVSAKLRPPSMPTAYVVDRGGTLRFASFGYHEGNGEDLAREAASLL